MVKYKILVYSHKEYMVIEIETNERVFLGDLAGCYAYIKLEEIGVQLEYIN